METTPPKSTSPGNHPIQFGLWAAMEVLIPSTRRLPLRLMRLAEQSHARLPGDRPPDGCTICMLTRPQPRNPTAYDDMVDRQFPGPFAAVLDIVGYRINNLGGVSASPPAELV